MASDVERYAALRTYVVRWGFLPADLSAVLRDVRATNAEFDAMADKAVEYVAAHVDEQRKSPGTLEYESWTNGVDACATEQDCEWQPWCRMQANCRKKVEADRTAKHASGVKGGSDAS